MTDAEMADAALVLSETLVNTVPDGTLTLTACMAMAISLGASLRQVPDFEREKAVDVMCDIIRQTARGERAH